MKYAFRLAVMAVGLAYVSRETSKPDCNWVVCILIGALTVAASA